MATILIIDDDWDQLQRYTVEFQEKYRVLRAPGSRQGRFYFQEDAADIVAIILDGNLKFSDPERTTEKIAADFRAAGFKGPMFAATTDEQMEKLLLQNGCSHTLDKWGSDTWLAELEAALKQ